MANCIGIYARLKYTGISLSLDTAIVSWKYQEEQSSRQKSEYYFGLSFLHINQLIPH